jgi:hypothetical protein
MNQEVSIVYRHTSDMGEISGFGGDYEEQCQKMLEAGVKHIEERRLSGDDVKLSGIVGVFGLCFPENQPTKDLEKAVVDSVGGDLTGAMHQAVMMRLAYIAKNGWQRYCEELRSHQ